MLTSVAGHGHNVAVGLEGRDDAHLVLGRDARKDGDVADSLAQHLGRHLVDGLARQAALLAGRHAQTEVACDRGRRLLGVAGDHDDVDAGRLKGGDGFSDTAPGRVKHSLEAGKDELLADCAEQLREAGFTPDELFIRDAKTLRDLSVDSNSAVILMAAWLGKARLIDNQEVDLTV